MKESSNHQFLLWSSFSKKKIILWILGDFFFKKSLRVFNFLRHFGGSHFLFVLCERGEGDALLLWILNVFCFIILKFQRLQFFLLSFSGFSKKHCVKFCKGGEGGIYLSSCELFKKLFSYFEVLEFSIFFLVILLVFKSICVKFHKGGKGVFALLLVNFESFLF